MWSMIVSQLDITNNFSCICIVMCDNNRMIMFQILMTKNRCEFLNCATDLLALSMVQPAVI